MSIERFILKKLSHCKRKDLRANLLQLLIIRIQKAEQQRSIMEGARRDAV